MLFDDIFYGFLCVLGGFCAVFRELKEPSAGGVLVVVFHSGLWQPWRASIFSDLCSPLSVQTVLVDADCKGLHAFFGKQNNYFFFFYKWLTSYLHGVFVFLSRMFRFPRRKRESNRLFFTRAIFFVYNCNIYITAFIINMFFLSVNIVFRKLLVMTQLKFTTSGLIHGLFWKWPNIEQTTRATAPVFVLGFIQVSD